MKKNCCPPFSWDKYMTRLLSGLPERQLYKRPASSRSISYRRQDPATTDAAKPTLVFLHGNNGSSKSWHYQFRHFTAFSVISIDAPGFGESSVFEGGIAGFADELDSMLSDLEVASFWLVGHSMGGMVAQILAALSGERCSGLVLSCTYKGRCKAEDEPLPEEVEKRVQERLRLDDQAFGTLRVERMLSRELPPEQQAFLASIAGEIRVEGVRWGGGAIQYVDTTPYLDRIRVPTLILSAANDIVVKPDALKALIAGLPDARHVEMAGVGHAPYCEDADTFNRTVEQFIISHKNT